MIGELDRAAATSSTSRATPSRAGSTATTAPARRGRPGDAGSDGARGTIAHPAARPSSSRMKVAVAVGAARRFVVGDPDIQLIDVLAGRLIDDLAEAEHHAEKGEIVLDPSAIAPLGDRVALGERRGDEETGATFGVVERAARRRRRRRGRGTGGPPEDARPAVAAARGLRAPARRPRGAAGGAPSGLPGVRALRGDRLRRRADADRQARRLRAGGAADHGRLRRQPPAADARRQGGVPVRGLRVADRPRGRCGAGGGRGPRPARPGGVHGRPRDPDRDRPRPPAQRHIRPRHAAHVRLPRRRREPVRPAHVQGAARRRSG